LRVAALVNGQVVNVAGIARDAAVARPTVQGYSRTLSDTLMASAACPGEPCKVKEVAHSKFYLFDPGVARPWPGACVSRWKARSEVSAGDLGAARTARRHRLPEHRWRTELWPRPAAAKLILSDARKRAVGIEVKASVHWRSTSARRSKNC